MRRLRFKTHAVEDYRPLVCMSEINMPWWCTGSSMDDTYVIIVCYLPECEDIYKYWDDAYDIYEETVKEIVYTDRLRKPSWIA